MGNESSSSMRTHQESAGPPEEPKWKLPSQEQDDHWIRSCMDHVFDDESLRKKFAGHEFGLEQLLSEALTDANMFKVSVGGTEQTLSADEAECLADSVACFAHPYDTAARNGFVERLTSKLSIECREEDAFNYTMAQRIHFLKSIHLAITRKWPRRINEKSAGNTLAANNLMTRVYKEIHDEAEIAEEKEWKESQVGELRNNRLRRKRRSGLNQSHHQSSDMGYSLRLGLDLFFTVLKCTKTENACSAEQYATLTREIVPFISDIQAISNLQDNSEGLVKYGILDKVCEFLFQASMGTLSSDFQSKMKIPVPTGDSVLPVTLHERTQALEALMSIAGTRANLFDFLLCIKVLLSSDDEIARPESHEERKRQISNDLSKAKPRVISKHLIDSNNDEETRSPREKRRHSLLDVCSSQVLKKLAALDGGDLYKLELLGGTPELVEMWTCGQNSYGELGHGDTNTRKLPKTASVLAGKDIAQVAAGNEHTVVLTKDGKVYAVGYNDNGQCGQGNTGRVAHLSHIESLNDKEIVKVHAYNGCEHTLCVASDGSLYAFGYNYRGQLGHGNTTSLSTPTMVPGFGLSRRVKYVSCSYYHSVVATDAGELYTFGRNDFGQLGLGDTLDRKEPSKVEALGNATTFISIGCGQYHTVVSLSNGEVFSCGKNDYGQLGLKLPEPHRRFTQIRNFAVEEEFRITELRCGYYHTLALASNGSVWAFGRNDYGQLGIGIATQKVFQPKQVGELDGKIVKVSRIAAGCYHSIAVDDASTVYVFGRNNHGQLGCGECTEQQSPTPIKCFSGKRVADVAAGFYHTIILTGGEDDEIVAESTVSDIQFNMENKQDDEQVISTMQQYIKQITSKCTKYQNEDLMSPVTTALMLFGNLDRLSSCFKSRQDKVHQHQVHPPLKRDYDNGSVPSKDIPYCVSSSPKTLILLVDIGRKCHSELIKRSSLTKGSRDTLMQWSYLLMVSLKLIDLNVAQLLWSDQGVDIQRELASATCNSESLMVTGIYEVHKYALEIIEYPPPMFNGEQSVLDQAAGIIMTGLELFYPTQELQVQLLASLMNDTDETDIPLVMNTRSPRSPLMKFQQPSTFTPCIRKCLLTPLLQRLANDELVAAIVPKFTDSHLSEKQLDNEPSVALLSSLLSSLVHQIASPQNDTSSDDSNAFAKLLLSLQKHLLSWAGDEIAVETSNVEAVSSYVNNLLTDSKTDESCFSWNAKIPRSSAWRCLLQYSDLVLRKSNEELQHLIEQVESGSPLSDSRCVVSQVTPSLVVGLMLFSGETFFATRLLPKVSETFRFSDKLCSLVPSVVKADKEYQRRSNETIGLESKPGTPKSSHVALPWLLQLEKSLASLGGKMASALVIGKVEGELGVDTPVVEDKSLHESYLLWRNSPILAGGIEPKIVLKKNVKSIAYPNLSVHAHSAFIGGHDEKISELREFYGQSNFTYKMTLIQGRNNGDAAAMDAVETSVFWAVLKHCGMVAEAMLFQQFYRCSKILECWKVAAELRMHLIRLRSEFMARDDDAGEFKQMCTAYCKRADFLLLFASTNKTQVDTSILCSKSSRWKRVRLMLRCTMKWSRVAREKHITEETICNMVTRFVKCPTDLSMTNLSVAPSSPKKPSSPSKRRQMLKQQQASGFSLGALYLMISNNERRAILRQSGLEAFKLLLGSPKLSSPKTDILRYLAPALRHDKGPEDKHYATRLGGVAPKLLRGIETSFSSLYQDLAKLLKDSVSNQQNASAAEQLLLLDAWAMTLKDNDLHLLTNTGIMNAIQAALKLNDSGGQNAKQLGRAAWTLFRLLLAQVAQGADEAQVSKLLNVLYSELEKSLEVFHRIHVESSKPVSKNPNNKHVLLLVDEPTRISENTGVQNVTEKTMDFSVSLWANLERHSHGMLFSRGVEMSCKLNCAVNKLNGKIEAWVADEAGNESERIFSKDTVEPNTWTHVTLIYENGQLCLFVNGVMNNQLQLETYQHIMFRDEPVTLGDDKLEGYIAQVKFHSRALSPIHIHVIYDQGAPEPVQVHDRHCFQLMVVKQNLTESEMGRKCLSSCKWLELDAKLLRNGTPRVQQAVIRTWRVLLPNLNPSDVAPHVMRSLVSFKDVFSGDDFADYLLTQVGLGFWHAQDTTAESSSPVTPNSRKLRRRIVCDTTSLMHRNSEELAVRTCLDGQKDTSHHSFALSSELIMLVRLLCDCTRWSDVFSRRMTDGMGDISESLGIHNEYDSNTSTLRSVGTLAVLGGHSEDFRMGGRVAMTHADITATIVSYDHGPQVPGAALIVMTDTEEPTSEVQRPLKALRINLEELVPIPEYKAPFASLSPKRKKAGFEFYDDNESSTEEEKVPEKSAVFEKSFFTLLDRLFSISGSTPDKTGLLAQCKARTLKVLHEILQDSESTFEQLFSLDQNENLMASLLKTASEPMNGYGFATLDGMEIRANAMRKRLHQLRMEVGSHRDDISNPTCDHSIFHDDDDDEGKDDSEPFDETGFDSEMVYTSDEEPDDYDDENTFEMETPAAKPVKEGDAPAYLVEELMAMGFPEEWCIIALRIQGLDMIAASSWIVDNLDMLSTTPMSELVAFQGTLDEEEKNDSEDDDEEEDHTVEEDDDKEEEVVVEPLEELSMNQKTVDRSLTRRVAKAKSLLNSSDAVWGQLEELLGTQVFDGSDFRGDSCPSYEYGYVCGALSLYNGLHADGGASRSSCKEEIADFSFQKLERLCSNVENNLSILYARSCLIVLLQRWRQWPVYIPISFSVFETSQSPPKKFMEFLQMILFRGPQIMPSFGVNMMCKADVMECELPGFRSIKPATDYSLAALMKMKPQVGSGNDNLLPISSGVEKKMGQKKTGIAASGSVLNLIIKSIRPCFEQMIRENNESHFCAAITSECIEGLQFASVDPHSVDTPWGMRDLSTSDKDAFSKGAQVELYSWLIGVLVAEACPSAFSVENFNKISRILASPNASLKCIAMQLMSVIIRQWGKKLSLEQECALRALPYDRIQMMTQTRFDFENRCGNVLYSRLVSVSVEFLSLLPEPERFNDVASTQDCSILKSSLAHKIVGLVCIENTRDSLTFGWEISSGNSDVVCMVQLFHGDQTKLQIEARNQMVCFSNLESGTSYKVKVFVIEGSAVGDAEVAKGRTVDSSLFHFDACRCGPNIQLDDKANVASFSATETWSTVMGVKGFSTGKHTWYIRVDESDSPYLFIGVANRHACLTTFLGGDENGWGYIGDRALYHKRNRVSVYGERFGHGDVIGVTLDMENGGLLSYSKNGKDLGVAMEGLTGKLFPAVAFYSGTQKVSFLKRFSSVGDVVEIIPNIPENSTIKETLQLYKRLHDNELMCQDAFECYSGLGKTVREMTCIGVEAEFPVAWSNKKFRHGQTIQTPSGTNAMVLGEMDGRFWVKYTETGLCWYLADSTGCVFIKDTANLEHNESRLSKNSFKEVFEQDDKQVDRAIVLEINNLCSRKGVNPFSISRRELQDILPLIQPRCKMSVDIEMIEVRFCYVKALNNIVSKLLPFSLEAISHEKIRSQYIPDPIHAGIAVDSKSLSGIESHSQYLRGQRDLIFFHTKRQVMTDMLTKTVTVPKRAEDDYDYPEELAQLMLNRPKAAFSTALPDVESRLSFSLFGQAFDELHFMEPKTLRIAYSHPMDEGQSRTFKVKFEGEGVDDYGGPYREVFSQWSAELMALRTYEEEVPPMLERSKDEEMECVLPLLHPCPNNQHGTGLNREKFVVKPASGSSGSSTHLLMEMYNFLGQLAGIAIRTKTNLNIDLATSVWKSLVGEPVNIEDLRDVDHSAAHFIDSLMSDQMYLDDLNWTTTLSDGSEIELFPGGEIMKVTQKGAKQFAHVVGQARLREAQDAIMAIRDGITSIIPPRVLGMFTAAELERVICGTPELDVELLKSCTEYDDDISENDRHIESFWRVLGAFSNINKQKFLRFVWARSRLPATAKDFSQKFKIQAPVGEGPRENPDEWLPKAHTCFFAVSLPKYTRDDIMREKLLYSINNCVEMDADFRLTETEMTGWDAPHVIGQQETSN